MSQIDNPFKEYAQEVNKTIINENKILHEKVNAMINKNDALREKLNAMVNEKINIIINENKALIQENTQLKEILKDLTVRLDKLERIINELKI